MRKLLAILLAVVMTAGTVSSALAVETGVWFEEPAFEETVSEETAPEVGALEAMAAPVRQNQSQRSVTTRHGTNRTRTADKGVLRGLSAKPDRGTYALAPKGEWTGPVKLAQDANERIAVIVELQSAPLGRLARSLAPAAAGDGSIEPMAISQAQSRQQALVAEQNAVISAFRAVDASFDVKYRYTGVFNGFATELRRSDLAALKADPRVKSVSISQKYDRPVISPAADESSGEMIYIDNKGGVGEYKGEGMLIAIIDTGIDYNHELLSTLTAPGKIEQSEMQAKVTGLQSSLNAQGTAAQLVKNDKVIFGYDYIGDYAGDGPDTDPMDLEGHGTHVAGIAAANSDDEGVIFGVAPNAQLMAMKVFAVDDGAWDHDILAAMEDATLLGVDVINLSLGSPAGFSSYRADSVGGTVDLEGVYQAARDAGVFVSIAAGNETSMGAYSYLDYFEGIAQPFTMYPDYGITGAPSTYADAVSVASVDNAIARQAYFNATPQGGSPVEEIFFMDSTIDSTIAKVVGEGPIAYVTVPGLGNASDFEGIDVAGKVALIQRGEIDFGLKVLNAQEAHAIAVVVYNHATGAEELIGMDFSTYPEIDIPAILIGQTAGEALATADSGTMTFSADFWATSASATGGLISAFSSHGPTPDLKIKPEITAPGGDIFSTWPTELGAYSTIGGTSMAAPHVAGAAALVKQYLSDTPLENAELVTRIENLLLSTALPIWDEWEEPYPVQAQGAGLMDVDGAISAQSILYDAETNKTKVELGDGIDPDAVEVSFVLENLGSSAQDYTLWSTMSIDYFEVYDDDPADPLATFDLGGIWADDEEPIVTVSGGTYSGGVLTVAAGQKATVTVTLATWWEWLAEYDIDQDVLDLYYPNGYYVSGFVYAYPEDVYDEGTDGYDYILSIPFLGFVGDWNDAPAFDGEDSGLLWFEDFSSYADTFYWETAAAGLLLDEDGFPYDYGYLGVNLYGGETAGRELIAISPEGNGWDAISVEFFLLRGLTDMWVEVTEQGGSTPVKTMTPEDFYDIGMETEYFRKSFYMENYDYPYSYWLDDLGMHWDGTDEHGAPVADGWYTLTIYGTIDYPGADAAPHTWSIDVYADSSAPELSAELDGSDLTVTAADNHELMVLWVDIYDDDGNWVEELAGLYDEAGTVTVSNLSTYLTGGLDVWNVYVTAIDYAGNEVEVQLPRLLGEVGDPIITNVTAAQTLFAPGNQGDDASIDLFVDGIDLDGATLLASVFEVGAADPWEIDTLVEGYAFDPADYEDEPEEYFWHLHDELYTGDVLWWEFIDIIELTSGANDAQFPSLLWIADDTGELDLVMREYYSAMPTVPGAYEIRVWIEGDAENAFVIPIVVGAAWTINATAGTGGSISPTGAVTVADGESQTFTITADENYTIADVLVDGESVGKEASYTFTEVSADHTIAATFEAVVVADEWTITATAGAGGSISPTGEVKVADGDDLTFEIKADSNYTIADVLVDGESVGKEASYTFTEVSADHTIAATFSYTGGGNKGGSGVTGGKEPPAPIEHKVPDTITDVAEGAWYYEDVAKIIETSLMIGNENGHFMPEKSLTREEFVTILYRFAGEPEVEMGETFADVVPGSWYEKAVIWAVAEGITNGDGAGFGVGNAVTRESMVAFLYRYLKDADKLGTVTPADLSAFSDSDLVSDWAEDAMAWAVAAEILNGVGSGDELAPTALAQRAQAAALFIRLGDFVATLK